MLAVEDHYRTINLEPDLRQKLIELFDEALRSRDGQDAKSKALIRRRLTELEHQEDRYIEAIADPDFPKGKITEKLRAIRDERTRLETKLNDTMAELHAGHATARRVLDCLDDPAQIYEQSSIANRTKLNRVMFTRLKIDLSDAHGVHVPMTS